MVFPDAGNNTSAFLTNSRVDREIDIRVLFRGYAKEYPIPGGYNKNQSSSPLNSLRLSYNLDTIELKFHEATIIEEHEESAVLTYNVYQHYLAERNLDEQSFLTHLSSSMLNLDDIVSSGKLVNDDFIFLTNNDTERKISFAAYPGTAVIFSVIVTRSIQGKKDFH